VTYKPYHFLSQSKNKTMQQKLNKIVFLVLGLIMGIGGTMFFGNHKTAQPTYTATPQSPADIKNNSVIVEAHFQG